MLDENLEDCPHPLGINQSLEFKPRLELFGLVLAGIVKITELVLFAKGKKKTLLGREARQVEANLSARVD